MNAEPLFHFSVNSKLRRWKCYLYPFPTHQKQRHKMFAMQDIPPLHTEYETYLWPIKEAGEECPESMRDTASSKSSDNVPLQPTGDSHWSPVRFIWGSPTHQKALPSYTARVPELGGPSVGAPWLPFLRSVGSKGIRWGKLSGDTGDQVNKHVLSGPRHLC